MATQEKHFIILDEGDGDEEVQFIGETSPLQPRTPTQTESRSSLPSSQSSSMKRKRRSADSASKDQRYSPRSRQTRNAQSLSRSQWTFEERRSSVTLEGTVEALSPCSTPTKVSISKSTINLDVGHKVLTASPPNVGKLSLGSEVTTGSNEHQIYSLGSKGGGVNERWQTLERRLSAVKPSAHSISILRERVIDLEEDDDLSYLPSAGFDQCLPHTVIDSDGEDDLEVEFEIIGSTTRTNQDRQNSTLARRKSTVYPQRNPPIKTPLFALTEIDINGFKLKHSTTVELTDGDFLQITHIIRNLDSGSTTLRGRRFQRNRDLNGLLPMKRNELCWAIDIDQDDDRPALSQSLAEVPISNVSRPRETRITNQRFPSATYRDSSHSSDPRIVEREAQVTVRWSYTTTWPCAKARVLNENAFCERVLRHLMEDDELVGSGLRMRDEKVKYLFRGLTERGGSYNPASPPPCYGWVKNGTMDVEPEFLEVPWTRRNSYSSSIQEVDEQLRWRRRKSGKGSEMVDLTDELPKTRKKFSASIAEVIQGRMLGHIDLTTPELSLPPSSGTISVSNAASIKKATIKRVPGQKYTYGDAFCGAGGATRGAQMAGLKVLWGFDFNTHACQTWNANFPSATLFEMSAFDVCLHCAAGKVSLRCDILHISPPCQFFSPAHTIEGKDDEMNTASLLACGQLLDVIRPRVVTLEQTFGIGHAGFTTWFNALIQQFTANGYSLRWKMCHLQDWGLPQRRYRLIIFASCPGEVLPHFPAYTHHRHPTGTLRPYTSVNSVLFSIPPGAPDHDLAAALSKPLHEQPWDGTSIAPRAITTHGGQNYHPSGTRNLTNREFAALQGFPADHVFCGSQVKRQIGNAVPSSVARVLFGAVRRALEDADGVEREVLVID